MAIWGSLNTSTMAMQAHSHNMGQISTNIANMNTTSYKEVETSYQTLLGYQANGNLDYRQYGIDTVDTRRVDVQGVVTGTSRSLDLAINGAGFFVTNSKADGSGDTYYTRDGGFLGNAQQLATDSDGDGQNDQSTILTSQQGHYLMGWAADASGNFGSSLGPVEIYSNAIVPGQATSQVSIGGNVPNVNGLASAGTYQSSLPIISTTTATGGATASHNVTMTWSKVADAQNTWTVDFPAAGDVASATVTPATVLFTGDGRLDTANGPRSIDVTVEWTDGSAPTTFSVDLSDLTQYSTSEGLRIENVTQDGYSDGTLMRTEFDATGVMTGHFSNGVSRALYKLPIATFAAPNKLEALNGNTYVESAESGAPTLRSLTLNDSMAQISPGSLETSNVVLEDQFTRMITTQKAYSSSATVFRTSDEMIQEVRNLKR
jgi:flagellar hook protein FlgE